MTAKIDVSAKIGNAQIAEDVWIGTNAEIQDGVVVSHNVRVGNLTHIGNNSIIGKNSYIGDFVGIGANVTLHSNVQVDDFVRISDNDTLRPSDHNSGYAWIKDYAHVGSDSHISAVKEAVQTVVNLFSDRTAIIHDRVIVKDRAYIGKRTYIGSGTVIGREAVIHQNAWVTGRIRDKQVVIAAPTNSMLLNLIKGNPSQCNSM